MPLSTEQFLATISKTIDLTILSHSHELSDTGPFVLDMEDEDNYGLEINIRWFDSTVIHDHRSIEERTFVQFQPASIKDMLDNHLTYIDISASCGSTPPESYQIKLTFEFPTVAGPAVQVSTTSSYRPNQNTLKHDKFISNHIPEDKLARDIIDMMNDLYFENYGALTVP